MLRATLALVCLAPVLAAQASLAGPRLFPRGARAPGVPDTRLDPAGPLAYLFTLRDAQGAVLVQYKLPLRHPYLARGLLRIEETTSGIVPMAGGGLSYRTSAPGALAGSSRSSAPSRIHSRRCTTSASCGE